MREGGREGGIYGIHAPAKPWTVPENKHHWGNQEETEASNTAGERISSAHDSNTPRLSTITNELLS